MVTDGLVVVSFDRHKTEAITMEEKTIPIERSLHLVLSKNKLYLGEVYTLCQDKIEVYHILFFADSFPGG